MKLALAEAAAAQQPCDFSQALSHARRISKEIAAKHAPAVDKESRFPTESVTALREAGLLAAAVPRSLGGPGFSLAEQAQLCAVLGQGCGSTAMVLAMHLSQLASVARHHGNTPFLTAFLREQMAEQRLLASITSEVGTWGDTRSSICALQPLVGSGERVALHKEATTGSYCASADGILVTCRRDADAPASDQRLLLVLRKDFTLTQTTTWDTLGMRGTVSPGYRLQAETDASQLLPVPYADIGAMTMVPWTHVLWSALWWGIAADAHAKASASVRTQARQNPGQTPPTAVKLAELSAQLQTARMHWEGVAAEFDRLDPDSDDDRQALTGMAWRLKLNHLKTQMSEAAPRLVHQALQIIGMPAYKNDSPMSLGRHYRDALSGALMINNDRIHAGSAALLTVYKDA
jgi:acyl-CoA dehydrogenase